MIFGLFRRALMGGLLACATLLPTATQATEVLRTMWRGQRGTYSTGNSDALKRLAGAVPVATTVVTHSPGLNVVVDGVTVTTLATFTWSMGSVRRVWALSGVQTLNGFQFGFGRWSQDASPTP